MLVSTDILIGDDAYPGVKYVFVITAYGNAFEGATQPEYDLIQINKWSIVLS